MIRTEDIPKRAVELLEPIFRKSNEELYDFLRDNPGPSMEQSPFARFEQRIKLKEHHGLALPNILLIGAQKAGTSAVSAQFSSLLRSSLDVEFLYLAE